MSKRLEILKSSLAKKEAELNKRFENHFDDVKRANGQPLNDKRNGRATMDRWERQSEAIRSQKASIEVTKAAIEKEDSKSSEVTHYYKLMPKYLQERIDSGQLKQWGKHPRILFIDGVEKARIYWDEKKNICSHKFTNDIPTKEQYAIFRDIYNAVNKDQSSINQQPAGQDKQ